ncbi:hypothetical protein FEM03_04370 [Phragmitibacter flavus]|uniref:Uncharacterized protein n=1 Tax=Phragmitibacter flavus TaxID=2576071 RepID=A0A5R8KJ44_9BACT|nr:hypothetical protein [Phragmitibacter flavus]TLD71965.1 hypothetical protein FEM03_04370 [Phragmitibacter flavus]
MSDLLASIEAEKHRDRQRWRWFIITTAIGLLVTLAYAFLHDDPPPDDAAITPTFTPGGGPQNPLIRFIEGSESLLVDSEISFEALALTIGTEDEQKRHLAKNTAFINAWDNLMLSDPATWRSPLQFSSLQSTTESDNTFLIRLQDISRLIRMKGHLLIRQGDHVQATNLAQQLIRFGKGITQTQGGIMYWLVGITQQHLGLQLLEHSLATCSDPQPLRAANDFLQVLEPSVQDLQLSLKISHLDTKSMLDLFLAQNANSHWQLRKNRTLRFELSLLHPFLDALNESGPAILAAQQHYRQATEDWDEQPWFSRFNPNATGYGRSMFNIAAIDRVGTGALHSMTYFRITRLMLAIRRHELDHQKLPSSLTELIPAYIPQIPLDPFDNQPLRWNPITQRIYSISADQADNNGSFKQPLAFKGPDFGMFYWWGAEAIAFRQKTFTPRSNP